MKKLSNLKLSTASVMTDEEMKFIIGGEASGCDAYFCDRDTDCPPAGSSNCKTCKEVSNNWGHKGICG